MKPSVGTAFVDTDRGGPIESSHNCIPKGLRNLATHGEFSDMFFQYGLTACDIRHVLKTKTNEGAKLVKGLVRQIIEHRLNVHEASMKLDALKDQARTEGWKVVGLLDTLRNVGIDPSDRQAEDLLRQLSSFTGMTQAEKKEKVLMPVFPIVLEEMKEVWPYSIMIDQNTKVEEVPKFFRNPFKASWVLVDSHQAMYNQSVIPFHTFDPLPALYVAIALRLNGFEDLPQSYVVTGGDYQFTFKFREVRTVEIYAHTFRRDEEA